MLSAQRHHRRSRHHRQQQKLQRQMSRNPHQRIHQVYATSRRLDHITVARRLAYPATDRRKPTAAFGRHLQ